MIQIIDSPDNQKDVNEVQIPNKEIASKRPFLDTPGLQTWNNALSKVTGLNASTENCTGYTTGIYTDWRLPNAEERISLIDYRKNNPALPSSHPFLDIMNKNCWYNYTFTGLTNEAWIVNLGRGDLGTGGKAGMSYVWSVRVGQ
ncbi:MAG: DUF1566 domain-containing protein [Magnetococcales bacterium]|nr:DUF1566 domain-containing protein [Magnetococcales bacterium]